MNLPGPGVLTTLGKNTLTTIVVLQQICAICRGATKVEETVPAAKRAQELLRELLVIVGDERYNKALDGAICVVGMVAEFDAEQVAVVGGMLARVPALCQAAVPALVKIG